MKERLALYVLTLAAALGMIVLGVRLGKAQENWYHAQEISPEARARLNVPYKSCCGAGDVFRTRFRLINDGSKYGSETYEYWKDDAWRTVPTDIIKHAPTPDGRPVLFLLSNKTVPVCFIIDREGG